MSKPLIIITPQEIMVILIRSEATAYRIWNAVKLFFKKSRESVVTVEEFCSYKGLDVEDVIAILSKIRNMNLANCVEENNTDARQKIKYIKKSNKIFGC